MKLVFHQPLEHDMQIEQQLVAHIEQGAAESTPGGEDRLRSITAAACGQPHGTVVVRIALIRQLAD